MPSGRDYGMKEYLARRPLGHWRHKPGHSAVKVICRWRKGCKPRNVAVECLETGTRWVRPFRGMRRVKP